MSAASPSAPFPKILVCTDGSPDSEGAISAALNLAKTTGSTVFLLEVLFYLAGYELQAPDTLAPPIVNHGIDAGPGDGGEGAVRGPED